MVKNESVGFLYGGSLKQDMQRYSFYGKKTSRYCIRHTDFYGHMSNVDILM